MASTAPVFPVTERLKVLAKALAGLAWISERACAARAVATRAPAPRQRARPRTAAAPTRSMRRS
jgi:hypothetical protein